MLPGACSRILLPQEAFEDIQPIGPEALVEGEPFMSGRERPGFQVADMSAAENLAADQPGTFQDLDVFRCGRERHVMWSGQLSDRTLAIRQFAKHSPARGVA